MLRTPISVIVAALKKRKVRFVLMGGQACMLYGATGFTRDVDVAVDPSAANLKLFRGTLRDLKARLVVFPPLTRRNLLRGHACHFKFEWPGKLDVRLDAMSVMRGAPPFEEIWRERRTLRVLKGPAVDVMHPEHLVRVKKTQREKDWPMLAALVEVDHAESPRLPPPDRIQFWLREGRTAQFLSNLVRRYPAIAKLVAKKRAAVRHALRGRSMEVEQALRRERVAEERADRTYWAPLLNEIERLRLGRKRK